MNPVSIGSLIAALGVILGAFGTHGLRGKIGYDLLEIYQTGTQYLMIHAFAIILYGLSKAKAIWPSMRLNTRASMDPATPACCGTAVQ